MTHTPTPWICDSEGILPISRDGVSIVARIPNHPDNKANWDADAAFIVRAVNSHQAMVEALTEAQEALNRSFTLAQTRAYATVTAVLEALSRPSPPIQQAKSEVEG
jgi:hypothetical protein